MIDGKPLVRPWVKRALRRAPFTGTVFVFRAERADRLKVIFWDGTGMVMIYKRLEKRGFAMAGGARRHDAPGPTPSAGAVGTAHG